MVKRVTFAQLLVALIVVAAAATQIFAPRQQAAACGYRPQAGACDGWSAGRPKMATIVWLIQHDSEFADWLLGHNEHGQAICGWRSK